MNEGYEVLTMPEAPRGGPEDDRERLRRLDEEMAHHVAKFGDPDQSDLDPRLVAMAEEVLARIGWTRGPLW